MFVLQQTIGQRSFERESRGYYGEFHPCQTIDTGFESRRVAYLFNTADQQQQMLEVIGERSIEDLFADIPETLRLKRPLDVPAGLTELELESLTRSLAKRNVAVGDRACFLGGGAYDHFIPAAVDEIASRGEYYTAYTPYQAEASQGSLQTFFEFQTLICQLTDLNVSNASMYEGGSSVCEAAFMAIRSTRRHDRIVVVGSINPQYLQVLRTNLEHLNCTVDIVPTPDGYADPDEVAHHVDSRTACVIYQHPNFFGCLEEPEALVEAAHAQGALAIAAFDPISLGVLKSPGTCGVDIAVAEGQSLGIPLQYGGPYLGLLACREEHVRKMPGRLIGQTVDRNGKTCYVLNLQAREQHIRRGKATSNICTNQGLMALRATVYLSLLGPQGLKEVAELSCQKAHYLANRLAQVDGLELPFQRAFFKEFTLCCQDGASAFQERCREKGFDVGPNLEFSLPDDSRTGLPADQTLLLAVTEQRTRNELDRLVDAAAKQ